MTSELPGIFLKYRENVELAIRKVVGSRVSPLYSMMEYHLGWADERGTPGFFSEAKRVRPTLCLLTCETLGGDPYAALPAAAAVELIHNFSLIHDDIQDGSPERHHRSTVWWLWGPAQAINAGDSMHALARTSLFGLIENGVAPAKVLRAQEILDNAALKMCEGQYEDMNFQERVDITVDAYLQMSRLKTGALIGCAMELGSLLAIDDEDLIAAFGEFGSKLGVAFQVRDDILDLWSTTGDTNYMPPGDILSKKKTLPVVYAMQQGDVHQKRQLGGLYLKRVLDPSDVPQVLAILEDVGAREFTQKTAEKLCQEALQELEEALPAGNKLSELKEVAEFFVSRTQ